MAVSIPPDAAPLGVSVDGKPLVPPGSVPAVSDFELTLAKNLRQNTHCGRSWVRELLDNSVPEAEAQLAALIADSGGRAIRHNEAGLKAQLQAVSDRAELYRRAVEAAASNAHIAPSQYPPALRDILTSALGRPY